MDLTFKGKSWVGNIYHKFESMCQEVDELVNKDTAKYVENQVQNVGNSVKKFCSDVVQDLLPPGAQALNGTQKDAFGNYIKSVVGIKEKSICGNGKHPSKKGYTDDHLRNVKASNSGKCDTLSQSFPLSGSEFSEALERNSYLEQYGDTATHIKSSIGTGDLNKDLKFPRDEKFAESSWLSSDEAHKSSTLGDDAIYHDSNVEEDIEEDSSLSQDSIVLEETFSAESFLPSTCDDCKDTDLVDVSPTIVHDAGQSASSSDQSVGIAALVDEDLSCENVISAESYFSSTDEDYESSGKDLLLTQDLISSQHKESAEFSSSSAIEDLRGEINFSEIPSTISADSAPGTACTNEDTVVRKKLSALDFQWEDESFFEPSLSSTEVGEGSYRPIDEVKSTSNASVAAQLPELVSANAYNANEETRNKLSSGPRESLDLSGLSQCTREVQKISSTPAPFESVSIASGDLASSASSPNSGSHSKVVDGIPLSFSGTSSSEWTGDAEYFPLDIVDDPNMETIDLSDKAKLDESCVFVDTTFFHPISCRSRRLRTYKKLLQNAFASKKRVAKEYEQLAIWYGDIDSETSRCTDKPMPSVPATYLQSPTQNACDSEWELL